MGRLPEIMHQEACMFDGVLAPVDEFSSGQVLGGDADGIVLVNHGVIDGIGASMDQATYRAATFNRICQPITIRRMRRPKR
jgi:hypothetical protein